MIGSGQTYILHRARQNKLFLSSRLTYVIVAPVGGNGHERTDDEEQEQRHGYERRKEPVRAR